MTPRLPNFFILGAARCGTTALHGYLQPHPQVFLPYPKEPMFFTAPTRVIHDPIAYADLFAGVTDEVAIGESSHAYLTHPGAARTLAAFFPDARFVLLFRDPADRALAVHSRMVEYGYEWRSFESALAAEDDRAANERFQRRSPGYFWDYLYVRSGFYGEQLDRYLEHFDRDRFLFGTQRELLDDPEGLVGRVHDFLGVDRLPITEQSGTNPSRGVRLAPVRTLQRRLLDPAVRRKVPGSARARQALRDLTTTDKPTMDAETRAMLDARFAADQRRFREITGIDLYAGKDG